MFSGKKQLLIQIFCNLTGLSVTIDMKKIGCYAIIRLLPDNRYLEGPGLLSYSMGVGEHQK